MNTLAIVIGIVVILFLLLFAFVIYFNMQSGPVTYGNNLLDTITLHSQWTIQNQFGSYIYQFVISTENNALKLTVNYTNPTTYMQAVSISGSISIINQNNINLTVEKHLNNSIIHPAVGEVWKLSLLSATTLDVTDPKGVFHLVAM